MKKWQWALLIVVFGVQILLGIFINFPPTEEQLKILLLLNTRGYFILWLLRFISLGILFLTFRIWKNVVNKYVYPWSLLILSISPAIFSLWYLHPLLLIKIFLMVFTFSFIKSLKKLWFIVFVILGIVFFNRYVLNYKPAIFNKFSLIEAQDEVMSRFTKEDSLMEKIEFPLWWRRISYNKYFFVYKGVMAEVLPYFDLESLYFQEVSPTEQKSMVMFYWPEILTLIVGIYFLTKNNKSNKKLWYLFLVSIFDYIFSESSIDKRLLFTMWPLSIVMALAWVNMVKLYRNKYLLARFSLGIVGGLLLLAFSFNFYDLVARKEYWFDNRPLAFQFWYENLNKINLYDYQKIYVTSIIGDSKKYCNFFIGKYCNESKWIFNSFDLEKNIVEKNTIYAGFAGEFVGSKFKNDISSNWKSAAEMKGLNFIGFKSLLNTIAYKYGNDIGVAIEKIYEK